MKLKAQLLVAIATYYIHRSLAQDISISPRFKWDKDGDLAAIDLECAKQRLVLTTMSGHFWFTRGKVIKEMSDRSFPYFIEPKPPKKETT